MCFDDVVVIPWRISFVDSDGDLIYITDEYLDSLPLNDFTDKDVLMKSIEEKEGNYFKYNTFYSTKDEKKVYFFHNKRDVYKKTEDDLIQYQYFKDQNDDVFVFASFWFISKKDYPLVEINLTQLID